MQSSFAMAYERNINPDGSINLTYKAERFGLHRGAGFVGLLFFIVMVPVSCAVTSPLVWLAPNNSAGPIMAFAGWPISSMILFILAGKWFIKTKGHLTIKPNVGLTFEGKNLPYPEIDHIGTANETTAQNPRGSAYVYATTKGQEMKITKYVSLQLAEAIQAEIKAASGTVWS